MNLVSNVLVACRVTIVTTVLLGLGYPLAVTGLSQLLFPDRANGQIVSRDGVAIGSRLIGQPFEGAGYFRSRPSATAVPYDASASGGSQLGPTNRVLVERVRAAVAAARRENPAVPVPIDLVTTSASGVDPHLSPAAAAFQAPRVARERQLPLRAVLDAIDRHTEPRQLGVLGEPRVNVLELNLALDAVTPAR
jgi:potassium-transporting ATPase KdpC subunit